MAKLYDVSVTTGSYEVNGEKKYRSVQIGSVWEGKDGRPFLRINRTFNPAGVPIQDPSQDSIICNMWEPRDGSQGQQPQRQADTQTQSSNTQSKPTAPAEADFDDDIPF